MVGVFLCRFLKDLIGTVFQNFRLVFKSSSFELEGYTVVIYYVTHGLLRKCLFPVGKEIMAKKRKMYRCFFFSS